MLDVHNILFHRLTRLAVFNAEGVPLLSHLSTVGKDETCSHCARKISQQPNEFGELAHVGNNCYGQPERLCVCCYAFSASNPLIMGVEKSFAPNTGQRFGMLAGSGALIELNSDRTWFFVPEGSAVKFPKAGLEAMKEMGVVLEVIPSVKQVEFIAKLQELEAPCLWVNNFGRKTASLIKNLRISTAMEALFMCTDDELNSASAAQQYLDVKNLMAIIGTLKVMTDRNAFLRTVYGFDDGAVSPVGMVNALNQNPEWLTIYRLLPKDPHTRHNVLSLASRISKA